MKKRFPLLLLIVTALAGCSKTNELYGGSEYNSPVFDENYYTLWNGVENLNVTETIQINKNPRVQSDRGEVILKNEITGENFNPNHYSYDGLPEEQFGYNNNLSEIEEGFNYGILSKLFDGRVRCEAQYQKSRVQVDRSGFAMFFPKVLGQTKYLAFAARGGSDFGKGEELSREGTNFVYMNFDWSFYISLENDAYKKVTYHMESIAVPTDAGGDTCLISFMPSGEIFDELYNAVGMSLTWSSNDPRLDARDCVDDYTNKEKHHLSLMLYEVFIGNSIWIN